MALARTTPTSRKPKTAAKFKLPKHWPSPGSPEFSQLPPEDRAWVTHANEWYLRANTAGDPSCMRDHEETEVVAANRAYYYPFLVKYFRINPRLFNFALHYLTGETRNGRSVAAVHKAWKDWLKSSSQVRHAAE